MTSTLTIYDAHQSGRFDATRRQRLASDHQIAQRATVALLTERLNQPFLIHGWGDHGTESQIVWDQEAWRLVDCGHVAIPTGPWTRGTSPRSSVVIPWVVLRSVDVPGFSLLRGGGHTPAHRDDPKQEQANVDALNGLAPAFAPIVAEHQPTQVSLSFDLNRQLTLARNADLIDAAVKPLRLRLLVPPGTTHKPRHRIDGFVVTRNRATDNQVMLDWMDGLDHRGILRTRKARVA